MTFNLIIIFIVNRMFILNSAISEYYFMISFLDDVQYSYHFLISTLGEQKYVISVIRTLLGEFKIPSGLSDIYSKESWDIIVADLIIYKMELILKGIH